jgi:phosphoribosylformimino-5-aminoimidazole carboxamide ribonucleotide (ProFAR) isomerase
MQQLQLLPAIDIQSGQVIQSKNLSASDISGSPQQVIDYFVSKGTKWIHLVDLDAAYSTGENSDLINNLITANSVEIQLSGGITNQATLSKALKTKAKWINLSTGALTDLDWVKATLELYPDRVCVSLDVVDESLIARGSGTVVGDLWKYVEELNKSGCKRFVVTDNKTDGKMNGPNFHLLAKVFDQSGAAIVASGGVSDLSDLAKLRQMGMEGVIVGKALYEGVLDLTAALELCYK